MVAALVAATELARICGFIGEEFRPEMLDIAPIGVTADQRLEDQIDQCAISMPGRNATSPISRAHC